MTYNLQRLIKKRGVQMENQKLVNFLNQLLSNQFVMYVITSLSLVCARKAFLSAT